MRDTNCRNSEYYQKLAIDFIQNKDDPLWKKLKLDVWLLIIDGNDEAVIYADKSAVEHFGTRDISSRVAENVYCSDFTNDIKKLTEISGGFDEIKIFWDDYENFLQSSEINSFHMIYPLLNPLSEEVKWVATNGTALIRDDKGYPVVIAGTFTDVTREFSLKKSNEQYLLHLQELTRIFRAGEAIGKFGFIEYNYEAHPEFIKCTDAAVRILNWQKTPDSLYKIRDFYDAIFEKDNLKNEAVEKFRRFVAGESEYKQVICPLVNGLWVECNATVLDYYLDGRVKRAVCSILDITDNYIKHEEIEALNDIFHEAEKTGQFGSYEFNRGKYANKFCITKNGARILGLEVRDDNLYSLRDLSSTLTATDCRDYVKEVTDYIHKLSAGVINSFNIKCALRVDDEIRWVKLSAHAKSYGADGKIATSIGAIVDITENMRLLKKTENLAFTDTMTGLLNKNALKRDFTESNNSGFTHYLFADINGFKAINDHFGHLFGDYCLEALARRLDEYNSAYPGKTFKVYRIYGDEFVLACSVCEKSGIEERMSHLLAFLDKSYDICSQNININLSVGIIEKSNKECSLEEMLRRVDQAMYIAKKNRLKYYILDKDEINFGFMLNKYMSAEVLPEDIITYYHPVVNIEKNKVIGYEFLSRLILEGKTVDPVDFFTEARKKFRLSEIDRIVFYQVIEYLDSIEDESLAEKKFFFNIDAQTVLSEKFSDFVVDTLQKFTRVAAGDIFFEINEKTGLLNLLQSGQINRIRETGIRIILDDFSASDHSLAAVNDFHFDYVKFSRGMLGEVMKNEQMKLFYFSLSELIHSYDIGIIAQGVETSEQLELISDCDISLVQGYYFSRPRELSSFSIG